MQETWVRSLAQADPLEKKMATHSNILAWEIPWTEDPGGCDRGASDSPLGHKESDPTEQLSTANQLLCLLMKNWYDVF